MSLEIANQKTNSTITGVLSNDVYAPCNNEGNVVTIDDDTKEGLCRCPLNPKGCLVDPGNRIVNY